MKNANGHEAIILIVEDSRSILAELKRSVDLVPGLRAMEVGSYAEAKEKISRHAKDIFLAILDLNLPDAPNGEIVDLALAKRVPSIVFTADFSEATSQRMASKEIIDYVVKDAHSIPNIIGYIQRLRRNREIKVLVVEDSDSTRFNLCVMLYQQMFQVVDVRDAEAAVEVLEKEDDIQLVIVDYLLPGMDGIELTKLVRTKHSKDEVAIIGISKADDPMLTAKFIKSGANDFIFKPFNDEEFICRVNLTVEIQTNIWELREANRVKNQFLGMAVHDLRSPIGGIKGVSELLLENLCGELNEEQHELIGDIHRASETMNDMVTDLLDISVIEAGKLDLKKKKGNLVELLEQRMRVKSISAKQKSIILLTDFQDVPEFVFDHRRIEQVIDNLLTNAIKFSPPGGAIDITLSMKRDEAQLCVRDYGQGVPADEMGLLFISFQKTSVRPTAGETSTGLGLPIVKKIVEAHEGRVWCESVYGEGAAFFFALPLK